MRLIFLGPPGAGKGTQAEKICKDYNIVQLSTGDILRANIKAGTELGKTAGTYMEKGALVPDALIIDMIKEELKKPELTNGYILDGFPRTVPQAEALDVLLGELGQKLNTVLVLEVPNEELIGRLTARRTCSVCGKSYHMMFKPSKVDGICDNDGSVLYQRDDDKEEPIRNRLNVYEAQTKPLIDYYSAKKMVDIINVVGDINNIYDGIFNVLESRK